MGDVVECHLLIELPFERLWLRRYAPSTKCERTRTGCHDAQTFLEDGPCVLRGMPPSRTPREFAGDPRWPSACSCGYAFVDGDVRQVFQERVFTRGGSGERMTLHDARPGDMWDAWWYPFKGVDGRSLVVVLPNGHQWAIDSRAANCTLPEDDVHRCWVRTGAAPRITVGKNAPGQTTCSAGAGSIGVPGWHGFLVDGHLRGD